MLQSETYRIPYLLVADPNTSFGWVDGRRERVAFDEREEVDIYASCKIMDLYRKLATILKDTHVYITIQFPCTIPALHATGELDKGDNPDSSRAARYSEWIKLVGYSGSQYDPSSVRIQDLRSCWPVEEDGSLKPMQVVAIPKTVVEQLLPLADETEEELKDRLHLIGSLYDVFYTKTEGRIITLPTVDSKFRDRKKIYIRKCWDEFQMGVIAHLGRFYSGKTFTLDELITLIRRCFSNWRIKPTNGEVEPLWRAYGKTQEWYYSCLASACSFPELLGSRLMRNDYFHAVHMKGQPKTGKSQMLLYLIHCLMQRSQKVVCIFLVFDVFQAILYILPEKPVITILVDKLNRCNPVRVRSHPSSLGETWYSNGFPIIRIVDSADPYPNESTIRIVDSADPYPYESTDGFFTVYAASPAQYEKHTKIDMNVPTWYGEYPNWKEEEFNVMLQCLGMTRREQLISRVDVVPISDPHPFVVGQLEMRDAGRNLSEEPSPRSPTSTSANTTNELSGTVATDLLDLQIPIPLVKVSDTPSKNKKRRIVPEPVDERVEESILDVEMSILDVEMPDDLDILEKDIPLYDDTEFSTSDGESDDLCGVDEEEDEEYIPPLRQVSWRAGKW
ncbi:hypothetical protein BLNAU_13176 [Blattamonas nauphoetae]|uniref:Uncharacterized protein n=1 Tax=Blattamonas nauphoetae TaxID=2049346 RepID=A0ABQ9XHL8_9EUKA|nr:hypothetical protein BLNAU_13176 [Blattamonas nauphoetae]